MITRLSSALGTLTAAAILTLAAGCSSGADAAAQPSAAPPADTDAATADDPDAGGTPPELGTVGTIAPGLACGQAGINGVTPCTAGYACYPAQLYQPAPASGSTVTAGAALFATSAMTCQPGIAASASKTQPLGADCLSNGVNGIANDCAAPNVCAPSVVVLDPFTIGQKPGTTYNSSFTVGIAKMTCQPPVLSNTSVGTLTIGKSCIANISNVAPSSGCASGLTCTPGLTFTISPSTSYPATMVGFPYAVKFAGATCAVSVSGVIPRKAPSGSSWPMSPYPQSFWWGGK